MIVRNHASRTTAYKTYSLSGLRQIPELEGRPLPGIQHKYRETVLFFPAQGQTCHAYCSFCFFPATPGQKNILKSRWLKPGRSSGMPISR